MFWVRSDLDSGNFIGGGGVLEPNPRTPGYSGEFGQKILEAQLAGASQIVSHILRMWRLKSGKRGHRFYMGIYLHDSFFESQKLL